MNWKEENNRIAFGIVLKKIYDLQEQVNVLERDRKDMWQIIGDLTEK